VISKKTAIACALYGNPKIQTLDWPAQSPDTNPIENVWSIIKKKLQGKRIFTLKQLSPC